MNILGGRKLGRNTTHEILYFRLGKREENNQEEKKAIKKEFFQGKVPMTKQNKIEWGKLVPNDEVVRRGGRLKKQKEKRKR